MDRDQGKEVSPKEVSPKLSEQALADYKLLRDEPAGHKKQQWTITNYVLILYGVIFTSPGKLPAEKFLLTGATIALCFFGVVAILANHAYLYYSRIRIDTVQDNIFKGDERTWMDVRKDDAPVLRGLEFTLALSVVLIFAAAILYVRIHTP